jgi:hypothetical protein
MIGLPNLAGGPSYSAAVAISADEQVIVGYSLDASGMVDACRWVYNTGTATWDVRSLGAGGSERTASGVSADGRVIIGSSDWEAFIWDDTNGARLLTDVALTDYGLDLSDWALGPAYDISDDGGTILCDGWYLTDPGQQVIIRLGNTRPGSDVPVDLNGGVAAPGGVTITFDDVTTGGETTVTMSSGGPPPPEGFELCTPDVYFDITTTATYSPCTPCPPPPARCIEVCINYETICTSGAGAGLTLRHYEDTDDPPDGIADEWVDVTTSLDTVNKVICGRVCSLSPFIMVEPDADGDALSDAEELARGTDPYDPDTDDDGLLDGTEVDTAVGGGCPDPLDADSDNDTLADGAEVGGGTNPCNADTDGDGVTDDDDPLPTDPGVTSGWLEDATRELATDTIPSLGLILFSAPNANAQAGRRNALANLAAAGANAVAAGQYAPAINQLQNLLDKIDGVSPPPDWMDDSAAKTELATEVQLLIELLEFLAP